MEKHIEKYKHHYFAGLIVAMLVAVGFISQTLTFTQAEDPLPPAAPMVLTAPLMAETDGTMVSFTDPMSGVTFELETDNTGTKKLLGSADSVTKDPTFVEMFFEPGSTPSATATVGGLKPNTEYYLYEDSYENSLTFTSDASGSYSFAQDTSALHHVWIQHQASTIYLDSTGVGCTRVGTWDSSTNTCTLNNDVNESVVFNSDQITLDCAGFSIYGARTGFGITANRADSTIKNCTVDGFAYGIFLSGATGGTLENNTLSNNLYYGAWLYNSNDSTVSGNTANFNTYKGFFLEGSNLSTVTENIATDNSAGIDVRGYKNTLTYNTVSASDTAIVVYGVDYDAYDNTISNNVANDNRYNGIEVNSSNNTTASYNVANGNTFFGVYFKDSADAVINGNWADSNGQTGIYVGATLLSDHRTLVSGNSAAGNAASGLRLDRSARNTVVSNNLTANGQQGMILRESGDNTIQDNTMEINYKGIFLYASDNNTITGNSISDNNTGLTLSSSSSNTIYNNLFENTTNFQVDTSPNTWNVAKTPGINIIGGEYLGGNYWSDYVGEDADEDRLGDTAYVIDELNQDNLPLMHEVWAQPPSADGDGTAVMQELTDTTVTWLISSPSTGSRVNFQNYSIQLPSGLSSAMVTINEAEGTFYVEAYQVNESTGQVIAVSDDDTTAVVELNGTDDKIVFAQAPEDKLQVYVPQCIVPPAGLVNWWDADSISGTTAHDIIGSNDGVFQNGAGTIIGKIGDAFDFDGTDDFVNAVMSNSYSQFTVDVWVNPSVIIPAIGEEGGAVLIASQDGPISWKLTAINDGFGHINLIFEYDDGTVHNQVLAGFLVGDPNPINIPFIIENVWQHVAVTVDIPTETVKFYIDGLEMPISQEMSYVSEIDTIIPILYIGGGVNAVPQKIGDKVFNGKIDEVEYFNRVLTQPEIQAIAYAGISGKCKPGHIESSVLVKLYDSNTIQVAKANLDSGDALMTSVDAASDANRIEVLGGDVEVEGLVVQYPFPVYSIQLVTGDDLMIHVDGTTDENRITVRSHTPLNCTTPPSGMVSWWDGEGSGEDIIDVMNSATLKNGATFSSGKVGQAFSFDGIDDYAEVAPTPDLWVDSITIDAWVNVDNVPGQVPIISHGTQSSHGYLLNVEPDDTVSFAVGTFGVISATKITRGAYNHIVATYDQDTGQATVYINGQQAMTINIGKNQLYLSSAYLRIAAKTSENYTAVPSTVPVKIDELEIFNRALTASEINDIYAAGSAGKCKPTGIHVDLLDGNLFEVARTSLDTGDIVNISVDGTESSIRIDAGEVEMEGLVMQYPSPVYRATLDTGDITNISLDDTGSESRLAVAAGTVDADFLDVRDSTIAVSTLTTGDEVATARENEDLNLYNLGDSNITLGVLGYGSTTTVSIGAGAVAVGGIVIASAGGGGGGGDEPAPPGGCGDGYCVDPETHETCPADCPADVIIKAISGIVDYECTQYSTDPADDLCFVGRKEHITNGVAELEPVNMQLVSPENVQTIMSTGETQTVAFDSVVINGVPYTEPANFGVLAPIGTWYDGDGTDNIECGLQLLEQGVVNLLQRDVVNGQQQCPAIGGVSEDNHVVLHIINQAKNPAVCGGAGSCKLPVEGAEVRVFDRNDATFQSTYGTQNPSGSVYDQVFESNIALVSTCTTDSTGTCTAYEPAVGDYLVVVKYYDAETANTVYTGSPKNPSDFVDGHATKDFQFIKVYKKNGSIQWSGGKKMVVLGSQLDVIYPLDAVWDEDTQNYLYPFIFVSDDNWTVDVCTHVPQGYDIVGVYDENGDLVASDNCYETFVSGETKVAAFDVVQTGSPPEWAMNAKIRVKGPNGKVQNLDLNVPSHVYEKAHGKPFQ